ncbi:FAD-dependent oxidoreductase [Ectobacillus antri]|jgi:glycine/D-amino acid oxidase-like deaminating enzyme|uniref:FAD-dependent oxidoreductase n=1 Tax=Ectobacillus antri TaxID=2486280 RepID=A0ABT6H4N6_9BACI|nr:FAD-dependent oxidoreductase [Ectobacillus antri]MDG4656782.1 FAD-dependent oxidoreductase [Ectobacillus antri]MDG5754321.1 FAD-dependent oxidoreductase [Ectobacillus antri]
MELYNGKPYWLTTYPHAPAYPKLEEDITCDVLIVGGGSCGAQCAYYMADTGLDVVVVDQRKVGHGSTCTNTALVQYLGDKMLYQLVNSFGETNAIRHTKLCEQAIADIKSACNALHIDAEYVQRASLYYASCEEDVAKLEKEYGYLQKHGFMADMLTEEQIGKWYPFKKRAALYVQNDGELNPYKFTIGLLEKAKQKSVRIFEETAINGKVFEEDGAIFYTKTNHTIKAKHVIIASGYEGLNFKKDKNALLTTTYAIVTNPVEDFSSWHERTLIWETARPYIYMRTTADNRIIIGGLDDDMISPTEREGKLPHKRDKLVGEFQKLFPNLSVRPEFYLGAYYAGTHDGLPMLGHYEEMPNCHMIFGYGDNGLVYNMLLAKITRDVITKGTHEALDIYLHTRPMMQ